MKLNTKLKRRLWSFAILFCFGYGLLIVTDLKIAIGVFLIHWYATITMEKED